MVKELSQLSLAELWTLFPIKLEKHNDKWAEMYLKTQKELHELFRGKEVVRISHIGSTYVAGIYAKPIVDILAEIKKSEDIASVAQLLTGSGWLMMSREELRQSFNRGYTKHGFAKEVYHLHLRYDGDHDELYFRDYLCSHGDVAREYERLKLSLWKKYEHDRDGYTQAKTEFILQATKEAKKEFFGKYEN